MIRTLIMSSCWTWARALTATGSSSLIVDRSWAMILSLACSSLHKCLVSLLASDSSEEQVDVLSPRWLRRMVVVSTADCRLDQNGNENNQASRRFTFYLGFIFLPCSTVRSPSPAFQRNARFHLNTIGIAVPVTNYLWWEFSITQIVSVTWISPFQFLFKPFSPPRKVVKRETINYNKIREKYGTLWKL